MLRPKPFLENIKLRNKTYGVRRRRDMSKLIMLKSANFPMGVSYVDIDQEFVKWVERALDISFDGTRLPTIRLFSNQRLSEYQQSWNQLDDAGNIMMNFKTITRENNPQKGDEQGSSIYNIPGEPYFPMFYVPSLQENGTEAYDVYEMKQPVAVNFIYTVGLITNKYELMNEFNTMVLDKFKAFECYIAPNGHAMPMYLDSITDESEYGIDNRKYYSQSYKIKVSGYVVKNEDFRVTKLPSLLSVKISDGTSRSKRKKFELDTLPRNAEDVEVRTYIGTDTCNPEKVYEIVEPVPEPEHSQILEPPTFTPILINGMYPDKIMCGTASDDYFDGFYDDTEMAVDVSIDDDIDCNEVCWSGQEDDEQSHYHHKAVNIIVNMPFCRHRTTFNIDMDVDVTGITTDNVFDFILKINGERADFSNTIHLYDGDEITVKLSRDDVEKDSVVTIMGLDPHNVYDDRYDPESTLDDIAQEENIEVDG